MIRQVLYSWGILYFPWGREDGTVVAPGMRIADPLSGEWECVEIVTGANPGFDSAVFKYVPASRPEPKERFTLHTDGTITDQELPGVIYGLSPGLCGPETMPVNAATPDDTLISINFVRRHIEAHIKWSRHYETARAFGHLKEALGL